MKLNRRTRVNAELQVVVVGCSDDLCSPTWAARQYLIDHGIISEIPDSNIHPVRNAGGVFTGEVMWGKGPESATVREHMFKQIGFLVEKKGATFVFITGHNPCAGCNTINVDVETQTQRLVEDGMETSERFNIKTVVILEEHNHGDHYEVIETFEGTEEVADAA
ncbi:MAG: hypothetical protein RL538_498 [Candidatus Parcubacteria bacterium]|jgi:carbonic anhydrase